MFYSDLKNPLTRHNLIKQINAAVDVPLLNEGMERLFISWLYDAVVHLIPADVGDSVVSPKFKAKIVDRVNNSVNFPVLPEAVEERILSRVYDTIAGFIVGFLDLPDTVEAAEKDATEAAIEELTKWNIQASNLIGQTIRLRDIKGTGADGRVVVADVREAIKNAPDLPDSE